MQSRRTFLKTALAAGPLLISPRVLGLGGPGANDRVHVGLIGLGGRCNDVAKTCLGIPGMRVVAVCDCFQPRVDGALRAMPDQGWKGYTDFREMIAREQLDAVIVTTTTHARAWVTCHAMAMGLDVYIEKPMALTIAEGRAMVNAARRHKRVTQVGTQQRSIPLNNWASDLVQRGAIGRVTRVLAPNFVGPLDWPGKEEQPLPEGGDPGWWDVWTNQAPLRPYHAELHRSWSTWRDYDGGGRSFGVTGWGAHSYDQIQRGLGTDDTGPVEVVLEEEVADRPTGAHKERSFSPNETGQAYYGMVKNTVGPRARVTMTYANGTRLELGLDADWGPGLGCIFEGTGGSIEINRDRIYADPDLLAKYGGRPDPLAVPETQPHLEDWVRAIKTRGVCTADIEAGQRASTLCYLVNIARAVGQVGVPLKWDPVRERFTNSEEANGLLALPRREGYELPA